MNSLKKGEGVPLLNFKGVPGPTFTPCQSTLWICSVIYYYLLFIIDLSYPKVFYKSILLSSKNVALRNLTSLIILKNVI